jgi:hypothetical protein
MRRIYFVFALLLTTTFANGQFSRNAIGLRLGAGDGLGTEISFQHGLTDINRIELDLCMLSGNNYTAWSVAGIYQWVWELNGGFNWYAGAGGRLGTWSWDNTYTGYDGGGILLGAVGDIGIEYSFPSGIQLGLDARPEIGLINHGNAFRNNYALSVRYRF